MPSYRVKTIVTATVEETWVIDSPVPLDRDQIESRLAGDDTIPGDLRHIKDTTVGEERDREVTKVETI